MNHVSETPPTLWGPLEYKVPRRVVPIECFPTTISPTGQKIQRHRLREMATELMRIGEQ